MKTSIVWFRKCLRLHDNPALLEACKNEDSQSVLPLFILDPAVVGSELDKISSNRMRFLIECLSDLDSQLKALQNHGLLIAFGNPSEIIKEIQKYSEYPIDLFSDYCSEPHGLQVTQSIQALFSGTDSSSPTPVEFFPAVHTLTDLESVVSAPNFKQPKSMKDAVKLFTEYFGLDDHGFFRVPDPLPVPSAIPSFPKEFSSHPLPFPTISIPEIRARISFPTPDQDCYFIGGETVALRRLEEKVSSRPEFVNQFRKPKTCSTNQSKDPQEPSTTGLSPYLSTGCLSVRQLWKECEKCHRKDDFTKPPESLHGQLLFREMFYVLSRSVENWDQVNGNSMCKKIDWGEFDENKLSAWEKGMTGFPYIDAMMRQLEATGWMHHLGRHAVSCFLTRGQLWQHWKHGRDVFEAKLLDSDWALNNANWLWLSGVAPFSMPYFRLYNPCPDAKSSLNAETKSASFIKFWIPELKDFPPKYIFEPHLAPESVQISSNCLVGKDYPHPIVDRKESARENLGNFKKSLAA